MRGKQPLPKNIKDSVIDKGRRSADEQKSADFKK